MLRAPSFLVWPVLALLLAAAPAAALDDPDSPVWALYRMNGVPTVPTYIDLLFARDLAAALKKDQAVEGEIGAISFDYRFNAQDVDTAEVILDKAKVGATTARVTARFANIGKVETVDYSLCLAREGWRIADAAGGQGQERWSLRGLLKLPARVSC